MNNDITELLEFVTRHYSLLDSHFDNPNDNERLMLVTLEKLIADNKQYELTVDTYKNSLHEEVEEKYQLEKENEQLKYGIRHVINTAYFGRREINDSLEVLVKDNGK